MPKKEPVPIAGQMTSSMTDLQQITNNVSSVESAESDLFGSVLMLKNVMNFLGSNSGSKKAILSADSHSFPDTAPLKSSESKIIGLTNFQSTIRISPKSNTSSMTVLISEEIIALSPS